MADYMPVMGDGPFTQAASATITGGQILENTGAGTVGPAGANSVKVVGVAAHDATTGKDITIHPISGYVHESVSPAGSAAGDRLATAAAGTVATGVAATLAAAGTDIGTAINTATAGNKVRWIGR
jgi:hypothetical protein